MNNKHNFNYINIVIIAALSIFASIAGFAQKTQDWGQTPETANADYITYQGRLMSSGLPANGTYDFRFIVTDNSGVPLQTVEVLGVPVSNGIFTARFLLNLTTFSGANGANMTVGVRQLPTEPFVPLGPPQPVSATPIAFRAHKASSADFATNSAQLNGVPASQYVLTGDARLSDARTPLPGSGSYIQNNISSQQPASFNITGAGKADVFNAQSYYLLNGNVVLAAPGTGNLFAGINAGSSNNTGIDNSFFGKAAGSSNTVGFGNSFFGSEAGFSSASYQNTFIGAKAGRANTTGQNQVFLGARAGETNTTGTGNIFIGDTSGQNNQFGNRNIFIGANTGVGNGGFHADDNILIGNGASVADGISNAIVIGPGARANYPNWIVLGSDTQNTRVSGRLSVAVFPGGGSVPLCVETVNNVVSLCSSSARFKDDIANFNGGLDLIKRLRPVSFTWKAGGMRDVGFVAEEVYKVEPLLASLDEHGEVLGVKYDRISTALVNAVNEQQAQIEKQQLHIKGMQMLTQDQQMQLQSQQTQIDKQLLQIKGLQMLTQEQQLQLQKQEDEMAALKQLVCVQNTSAPVCKSEVKR